MDTIQCFGNMLWENGCEWMIDQVQQLVHGYFGKLWTEDSSKSTVGDNWILSIISNFWMLKWRKHTHLNYKQEIKMFIT